MRQRTVVMYVEIGCFLSCLSGWILICSTLATEYWTFSEVGSVVLTTGNYYSNLWMDCVSDTTGVSDCKYYPSMMDLLPVFIQNILNCAPNTNGALTDYSYTYKIVPFYCLPVLNKLREFELGAALFIGWGGSCLVICGSAVMCYFSARKSFPRRKPPTYMTARTRRTYMLPGSSRPTTVIIPPSHQSYSESRGTRASGGRRGTQETGTSSREEISQSSSSSSSSVY
uniref:Claudin n=1 Tax=Cyprinus carpio TaxID=7962 RepID=A0A8C2H956_CYPCA